MQKFPLTITIIFLLAKFNKVLTKRKISFPTV